MKKILIIQSAGMHDGKRTKYCKNDHLRECLSLQRAFQNNNWDATVWGLRHKNFTQNIDFNSYDYILTLENYEMKWLPDFSKITKPIKMQWIIDLHVQKPEVYGKITNYMDIVLHSTKSLMINYGKKYPKQKHLWFPNGYDDAYFKNLNMEKTRNVIFIGNVCNRRNMLLYMKEKHKMNCFNITGIEMINMINKSKVHFNKSVSMDVNYRNFETMGCGTCLLTNHLEELEELGFIDGVNCFMYKNDANDLDNKVKLALENWEKVGTEGEKFVKKHTYTNRVKDLIKKLKLYYE